jgi:hypothetical protein
LVNASTSTFEKYYAPAPAKKLNETGGYDAIPWGFKVGKIGRSS